MVYKILHKLICLLLIIIPIFVMGWLVANKLAPSGKAEAVYDMRRETPFISKLYPKDRVSEVKIREGGGFYRSLSAESVYFDLKPSASFEKVSVTIKYKIIDGAGLRIGGLGDKRDWLFDFRNLAAGEGWRTQTEIFDFSKMAQEGGKFRFVFSVSGTERDGAEISEIRAVFERKRMTLKGAINKILDAVARKINRLIL